MIISPPFLPQSGLASSDETDTDPMMTAVEALEPGYHGVFPVTFDRRWHGGIHLVPGSPDEPVRAIADGEVVAYRVSQNPISDGHIDESTGQEALNTNNGFVLLRHVTDTGDGRTITFYSLYMHLLDLTAQQTLGAQQPVTSSQDTSPPVLAAWLLQAGDGVRQGNGNKVHRKDILGHWGQSQGLRHLHFEIFMTGEDFTAWLDQSGHSVQLGEKHPVQPTSDDWWGHAYFVIPATAEFVARPGTPHDDPWFPVLSAGKLPNDRSKLYVEAYFHKGQRYTRAWLDENGDGNCVLLTPQPVKDNFSDYEYKLYERALAFYSTCPSDGYELLRFGRILTPSPTLNSAQEKATWVAVPFDANGTQAYVDISRTSVIKLSDADFPFFTGWQKIDSNNAPLDANGLFSYRRLRQLIGDAMATAYDVSQDDPKFSLDDQFTHYVQGNDTVRSGMAGFVCHTSSEWDPVNNDQRYQDLNKPDGYFGKCEDTDPDGYERFSGFLKKLQFMDQIPSLAGGKKFWFFHPLAFIRHFRKCGWLSQDEFKQIYSDRRYSRHQQPTPDQLRATYLNPLNLATRKFGLTSQARLAHFLGQGAVESAWLTSMQETSMLGQLQSNGFHGTVINAASTALESTVGHWYGQIPAEDDAWFRSTKFNSHATRITGSYDWRNGNCDREDAQKFRGRGFKQLTGRSNYADYWTFKGWISGASFTASWWTDPAYLAHNRSDMTKIPAMVNDPQRVALPENCLDSAGFYLRFERPYLARHIDQDSPQMAISDVDKQKEQQVSRDITHAINGGYIDWDRRLDYTRSAKNIIS
jgi:predicted chitinase